MRILVADDNADTRYLIETALAGAGHDVVAVADGLAAWQVLQQPDAPKLAVIDWLMPGLDGLELIRVARKDFENDPVYSILVTARNDQADMIRALESGANDYLTKPFNVAELLARVQVGARVVHLQTNLSQRLADLQSALIGRHRAEEALIQEQDCLRSLMDHLPTAIYFKDWFSRFTRINTEQARRMNLSNPQQAIGLSDRDFFSEEHATQALADEQQILSTGEPMIEKEEKETWPDGRVTWVASTKMPLRLASGEIIGTFGISRDITERRKAEEASRFLASIVESSDDAISGIDLDGHIISWNRGAENLYGYSAAHMIGCSPALLFPTERLDEFTQIMEEVRQGERILHFETEQITREGARIAVAMTISPIRNGQEDTIGAALVARDITVRKKAEDELYESRQKLQLILDSIPQRVFWKDRSLAYLGCNRAFAVDAGLTEAAQIYGKSDYDLSWRETAEDYRADDLMVMQQELPKLNFDERLTALDGTTRWLRTSKLPLRDRTGNVVGVLGTFEDITDRKMAEEALRTSESRYRLLFERNLAGVFRTSLDGRVLDCNLSAAHILGYRSVQDVLSVRMDQIHASPQARAEFLSKLLAQGSVTNLELSLRRQDGTPVWVMGNISYVAPTDGAEGFLEGTIVDITDRKRAEEALAEEARLAALRAEIGTAFIRPGTLSQGLQQCTDALMARLDVTGIGIWTPDHSPVGLALQASSGTSSDSIPMIDFATTCLARHRRYYLPTDNLGGNSVGEESDPVMRVGYPLIVGDKLLGVFAVFGKRALNEPTLLALAPIASQIAQFIQAKGSEEALLRSEERARLLFATIPHPAYVFDLETLEFKEVNDVAVRHYGYTREEFLRMKTTDIGQSGEARRLEDYVRQSKSANASAGQWKHRTRDGRIIDVEINFHLLDYDGRRAALTVAQDVSERNKLEVDLRHAQKLEAVGGLAAGIAHEINTPIQFVGDNLRFLQDAFSSVNDLIIRFQKLPEAAATLPIDSLLADVKLAVDEADLEYLREEVPKALTQSAEGIERVASIVKAMKDFAHPGIGERAAADLNQALASTLVVARNEVKYVADVVTDFGDLPAVECSIGDLNQVFLNILVNAAHAIEEAQAGTGKKGLIRVQTRHEANSVRIGISDTGSGIPENVRAKVFEPFFTTKRVGRGTGQGLAISRSIVVEKHGGTLTFDTETGQGTTFWITLPVSAPGPTLSPGCCSQID